MTSLLNLKSRRLVKDLIIRQLRVPTDARLATVAGVKSAFYKVNTSPCVGAHCRAKVRGGSASVTDLALHPGRGARAFGQTC